MRSTNGLRSVLLLLPVLALACASPASSDAPAAEANAERAAPTGAELAASVDAAPAAEELDEDEAKRPEAESAKPSSRPSSRGPADSDADPAVDGAPSHALPGLNITVPSINGGLDRDIIRRTASDHAKDVRSCHGRALAANPDLAGKIIVELTIGGDGSVVKAKLGEDNSFTSRDVEACVLKLVEGWEFASPSDGKQARAELAFSFGAG